MKGLFSLSFRHQDNQFHENPTINQVLTRLDQIDSIIQRCAPEWPLNQINKVDLAILRLSINELITNDTPYKVVIDEAVELAKEYGSSNSAKFVNGVLGTALKYIEES